MKLPEKQSELLRLAVNDAKKIAQSNTHTLDMYVWFEPSTTDQLCTVCMAGAVMVNTLAAKDNHRLFPIDFEAVSELCHINNMRRGHFHSYSIAKKEAKLLVKAKLLITDNFDDQLGRAPWDVYLEAADILEEAGL